jgi:hypothetical protein
MYVCFIRYICIHLYHILTFICIDIHICVYIRRKNSEGWKDVAFISIISGYCAIFVMGISGYLIFGDTTDEIILSNFSGHYADFFKLQLIMHLILYTPLDFVILRCSLLKVFRIKKGFIENWYLHSLVTIVILGGEICI